MVRVASMMLGALGLAAASGCAPAGTTSDVERLGPPGTAFPSVTGINLEGREIALPDGFEGERNLVLVAFEREHQTLVDTWLDYAGTLELRDERVRVYEVPTIYEVGALYRSFINSGMRAGIPDPQARARTITVYLDRERFVGALDLPDMSTIYPMLIDETGAILWRGRGPLDPEQAREFEAALSVS